MRHVKFVGKQADGSFRPGCRHDDSTVPTCGTKLGGSGELVLLHGFGLGLGMSLPRTDTHPSSLWVSSSRVKFEHQQIRQRLRLQKPNGTHRHCCLADCRAHIRGDLTRFNLHIVSKIDCESI